MHFYGIVRGRPNLVRRFKENCEDVFLPYVDVEKEDGTKDKIFAQLVPRKVELVEFVFPEQHLASVLKTLFPHWEKVPKDFTDGMKKELHAAVLRKILSSERIPKVDLKDVEPLVCRGGESVKVPWVDITPIGIKKDKKNKDGVEIL